MSKYTATIALDSIEKIQLYVTKCKKTLSQVKSETGADYILNGGLWNPDLTPCVALKVDGKLLSQAPSWSGIYGFGWGEPSNFKYTNDYKTYPNFISCTSLISNGKKIEGFAYDSGQGGSRGRSAIGMKGNSLCLYCAQDGTSDAQTPEGLQSRLMSYDWDYAIMLDGGGSSMCNFDGKILKGDGRKVHNWILVYLKDNKTSDIEDDPKEGSDTVAKKVVLDPGHGIKSNNQSPDKSFSEPEFALDMARRMEKILMRHGVDVTLTRVAENNPTGKADTADLQYRCNVANAIKDLSLYVSLHSNAAGNGNWHSAKGWEIYTSSAGDTAGRNIAANKIVEYVKAAGVTMHGTPLKHSRFYVLVNTVAPAVLIEHGFHTNKEDVALMNDSDYRDKIAVAECKGILDYLGIPYKEEETTTTTPSTPESSTDSTNQPSSWAKEAWEKAVEKNILDGTSPQGACTREMLATVLNRLGFLD